MRAERLHRAVLAIGASVVVAGAAMADDPPSDARVQDLEQRVQELEAAQQTPAESSASTIAEWTRRIRLSGSANTGWYGGQQDSVFHRNDFQVWDARFFLDAELGEDVRVADTPVVRNAGFTFEWDLVRLGNLSNRVGELYSDFQGLGDSSWANLQVGRFEIPVGENYLRFSKGYRDNPFITNTVGGPWYWDEGVRFYGADDRDRFGYVASISDGESSFNADANADYQYTLKLFANATDWLHLSLSGEYTGRIGSKNAPGNGALWLGESWARAFGSGTSVANYDHGVIVNDGPNRIDETYLLGADAIVNLEGRLHLWLAYGTYSIDQAGGSYDRRLHYWIAELLLYGGLVTPQLSDFYVGFRADGLGTYDSNEGYLLDFRYRNDLGYNMESLNAYSAVVGWKMLRYVTVRAEYSHLVIDLVRGVSASIGRKAGAADSWGLEVGVHF